MKIDLKQMPDDGASAVERRVMRHTPGPWRVERQNPSPTTGEWMISGAKPGYLAEVRDCGSGDVAANAKLIAAAPDLLAAIEAMRVAGGRAEFHAAFEKAKKLAMVHNVGVQGPAACGRSPGTTG